MAKPDETTVRNNIALMNLGKIAFIVHEANRAYCQSIGDNSQPPWSEALDHQKHSTVDGIKFIIANPKAPASASHDNWFKFKQADGWSYGPVKDETRKQHPCFVPFDELPIEQQIKDHIFRSIVRGIVASEALI